MWQAAGGRRYIERAEITNISDVVGEVVLINQNRRNIGITKVISTCPIGNLQAKVKWNLEAESINIARAASMLESNIIADENESNREATWSKARKQAALCLLLLQREPKCWRLRNIIERKLSKAEMKIRIRWWAKGGEGENRMHAAHGKWKRRQAPGPERATSVAAYKISIWRRRAQSKGAGEGSERKEVH